MATEKDHAANNTYRAAKRRQQQRLRAEIDEIYAFVDPEFDEMEEGATQIAERYRARQGTSD